MNEKTIIDVRQTAPPERHPLILQTFESLGAGEAFILSWLSQKWGLGWGKAGLSTLRKPCSSC
ncbi:MAG TPA: DUF2249 domain-containing protein [Anaerolineales bacterium]